jgi:hypothetical protein|tara:strand:+ start:1419 stop:2090 length:672 start_codon:yes stop_codon:yes gene_type:complete
MKKILARGGIEFLAVLLGISMSFNVDEWKQDKEIEKRLKSDYINIQKDLQKDIILLEEVLSYQQISFDSGLKALEMIRNKEIFDYENFINNLRNVWNSGTFFGTSSAYDASISSGRLTYFGNDKLANEIGIIYGHFYSRMDLNGEQLDSFWYSADFGIKYFGSNPFDLEIKKINLKKIFSNDYLGALQTFIVEIQGGYIRKAENALNQMKKVDSLFNIKIKEL